MRRRNALHRGGSTVCCCACAHVSIGGLAHLGLRRGSRVVGEWGDDAADTAVWEPPTHAIVVGGEFDFGEGAATTAGAAHVVGVEVAVEEVFGTVPAEAEENSQTEDAEGSDSCMGMLVCGWGRSKWRRVTADGTTDDCAGVGGAVGGRGDCGCGDGAARCEGLGQLYDGGVGYAIRG